MFDPGSPEYEAAAKLPDAGNTWRVVLRKGRYILQMRKQASADVWTDVLDVDSFLEALKPIEEQYKGEDVKNEQEQAWPPAIWPLPNAEEAVSAEVIK